MFTKGTKAYSILNNVCPRCQSSKFWPKNNPYTNIFVKNNGDLGSCKSCNLKFEIELGFWYGAMYVSYALSVSVFLIIWLALSLFFNSINVINEIIIISISLIIISPVIYFLSRLIWINIFISFNSKE